ncbi:hypothetical protein HMPREF1562_0921 [Providencia alcalifaciens F90-2004]|uniref:Uncharacterized protein n=1 Tax=Providencia alcalifaciens 205/92 TaxID=1256988 RepID=A0AAV3M179_9GAMM|nr:hypothetical protein HMPREF1562_0921 [Providencia alcalifaciens F90-2004]EUD09541.1 hypothetical protein HMPREF1563_4151 [Providencia alcalifaciens 205/92]
MKIIFSMPIYPNLYPIHLIPINGDFVDYSTKTVRMIDIFYLE